jgi:lactate dehydrogenase-like 2-hydroxyacid dehydrogenase
MTRPGILVHYPPHERLVPELGKLGAVTRYWDLPDPLAFAASPEGQAIAVATVVGPGPIRRDVLDALGGLRAIVSAGIGYDGIDLPYVAARGLQVSNTPHVGVEDVADLALALVLASTRRVIEADAWVREGRWDAADKGPPHRALRARPVGIVGLGEIGHAVGRRLAACGAPIRWWGPRPKSDAPWPRAGSLMELARESDILILCAALTGENRGMVGTEVLRALGPTGLLVNVARGGLVDEDALIALLREGALGAAALDVFIEEPTPHERWRGVPNVVMTPHTGSVTDRTMPMIDELVVANVRHFLKTGQVLTPIPEQAGPK